MQAIEGFAGTQLRPGDAGYDEARAVHNAMIDRRPALVAQCEGPADVALALAHARRHGAPVAVRSGGHSVAGMSVLDDAVVIDVRPMDGVEVDAQRRVAKVGAGATWSRLDRATQVHGLATTGGRVSTTGVAGLTLGGGSGWLERSHGLACDNLVGLDMVTAEGALVHASEQENPDLLWAMRGGGGNFGVVTSLELRLHPVGPTVFAGMALYDPADARDVVRAYRDFHSPGPREAGTILVYLTAPPEDFVPAEWQGRVVIGLAGLWNGPAEEGERALRGLIGHRPAVVDLFGEMPYADFQCMIDDPPGMRNYWTADYLDDFTDEAIEAYCAYGERMPSGTCQAALAPWGGAVAEATLETSPMAKRDAAWVIHPFATWEDAARDADHIAWGRESHTVFAPWTTGGVYLNFVGDEGQERIRAAFGEAYDRLVAVKAKWDPENVFRGNQNIAPSAVDGRITAAYESRTRVPPPAG